MKKLIQVLIAILILSSCTKTTELNQWRGDNRDGVYNETNLLKEWPEEGPELLWEYEGIGNGYGSPTITSDKIFVNGELDSLSHLFAFDLNGQLLWKFEYDSSWVVNFPGSRSTPTVIDNLVYTCSPKGEVICVNANEGTEVWSLNMIEDFGGVITRFGFAQSLLVEGDKVIFAPGNAEKNVVAVNRFTGEEIWASKAMSEKPAFCSPKLIELETRKLLVTYSEFSLFGLDAENGDLLWRHQDSLVDIKGNTPLYEDGHIYAASYGNGTVKLKLSEDGSEIQEIWKNLAINSIQEGVIKVEDKLIGTAYKKFMLNVIDDNTGELIDSLKTGNGSSIYADGLLYFYNEKGPLHLIQIKPEFKIISTFRIKKGTKEHFAHPVIKNGVLYVRRGNIIQAYNIKKEE